MEFCRGNCVCVRFPCSAPHGLARDPNYAQKGVRRALKTLPQELNDTLPRGVAKDPRPKRHRQGASRADTVFDILLRIETADVEKSYSMHWL